jgi:hypothetical protein
MGISDQNGIYADIDAGKNCRIGVVSDVYGMDQTRLGLSARKKLKLGSKDGMSGFYRERPVVFNVALSRFYFINPCKRRTLMTPDQEMVKINLISFSFDKYRTVIHVFDKSFDTQLLGFMHSRVSEADTLDPA